MSKVAKTPYYPNHEFLRDFKDNSNVYNNLKKLAKHKSWWWRITHVYLDRYIKEGIDDVFHPWQKLETKVQRWTRIILGLDWSMGVNYRVYNAMVSQTLPRGTKLLKYTKIWP